MVIDAVTGFATIVSLAAEFVSQRRAKGDASIEEFKEWLALQRHAEAIKLLESNAATTVGVKALLHESHSQIISRLDYLCAQKAGGSSGSDDKKPHAAGAVEKIVLGRNNLFIGTPEDIEELATRCAIYAIEGKEVEFQVELQAAVLESSPDDPLLLARYRKSRLDRSMQLKKRLELLTSKDVYTWWQYFLGRKEDWVLVVESLISRANLAFSGVVTGHKIDVWRTAKPHLSAPVYLSEQEIVFLLEHLGFESTRDIRLGPHWRAVVDMPHDLIAKHVIPSIIVQLESRRVEASGDVLNLAAWHIGDG